MRCKGHNKSALEEAAGVIRAGGLVAMPTETVYGLAADASNDMAVAKIFEAKGRPTFNPLIAHVSGLEMARTLVEFSPLAEKLCQAFWPGPLTLVLPRREDSALSLLATAGLDTAAIRAPSHPMAQALIEATGRPLAAPSANRSGSISPTTAAHVEDTLKDRVDLILDGGAASIGIESTIISVAEDQATLLRPGGIPRSEIEAISGVSLRMPDQDAAPSAPGMLASHYAPSACLRLNATAPTAREVFLAFGRHDESHPYTLNLSRKADTREAAANLFAMLREADALCAANTLSGLAAAAIPMDGLGEAINDRLMRAAAPRS